MRVQPGDSRPGGRCQHCHSLPRGLWEDYVIEPQLASLNHGDSKFFFYNSLWKLEEMPIEHPPTMERVILLLPTTACVRYRLALFLSEENCDLGTLEKSWSEALNQDLEPQSPGSVWPHLASPCLRFLIYKTEETVSF